MIVRNHRQNSFFLLIAMQGSIVPTIAPKIFLGAALGVLAKLAADGRLGTPAQSGTEFSFAPFTALGVAISLFLGFHNNSSYARWWEARILWGRQIIAVRNLTRFVTQCIPETMIASTTTTVIKTRTEDHQLDCKSLYSFDDASKHWSRVAIDQTAETTTSPGPESLSAKLVRFSMAHTHAMRNQFRPSCRSDATSAFQDRNRFLQPSEIVHVDASPNPADTILQLAGRQLRYQSEMGEYTMIHISELLDVLCEIQTALERIHNTSLPFVYSLLVHRTAFLYVALAPFPMARILGWWTPLFNAILAYTFFGLDEVARQIQEPFRDEPQCLALSAMCRTIERDVCYVLGLSVPAPLKPINSVLM